MIELMKQYLPNFDKLRKSKQLRAFGLRLTALQQVTIFQKFVNNVRIINNNLNLGFHYKSFKC